MYEYAARVVNVVDGDTVDAAVNLGFDVVFNVRFRLYGVNTPEKTGASKEKGLAAKAFAENWLKDRPITVKTVKDKQEKFGRYLAVIQDASHPEDGTVKTTLNQALIDSGNAVAYFGGRREP